MNYRGTENTEFLEVNGGIGNYLKFLFLCFRQMSKMFNNVFYAFSMLKLKKYGLCLSLFISVVSFSAYAENIAVCGASQGYAYSALRKMTKENDAGWHQDGISNGKFTLLKKQDGTLDILSVTTFSDVFGVISDAEEGVKIVLNGLSNESATIVALHPEVVATYVFQKLNNGKYQVMYTRAKAESPFPEISGFVADCSYLNLEALQK